MPYHSNPLAGPSAIQGQIAGGMANLVAPFDPNRRAALELSRAQAQRLQDETANDATRTGIMGRQADASIANDATRTRFLGKKTDADILNDAARTEIARQQALATIEAEKARSGLYGVQIQEAQRKMDAQAKSGPALATLVPGMTPEQQGAITTLGQGGAALPDLLKTTTAANAYAVATNPNSTTSDNIRANVGADRPQMVAALTPRLTNASPGDSTYATDPLTGSYSLAPGTGPGGGPNLNSKERSKILAELMGGKDPVKALESVQNSRTAWEAMNPTNPETGAAVPNGLNIGPWAGGKIGSFFRSLRGKDAENEALDATLGQGAMALAAANAGGRMNVFLERQAVKNAPNRAMQPDAVQALNLGNWNKAQQVIDTHDFVGGLLDKGVPYTQIKSILGNYQASPDASAVDDYNGVKFSKPVPIADWFAKQTGAPVNISPNVPAQGAAPQTLTPQPTPGQFSQKALSKYPEDLLKRALEAVNDPQANSREKAKAQAILRGE